MIKLPAKYYSHGKLLLTGEYLVMFGAESLALPVKFGQEMIVEQGAPGKLLWKAYIQQNEWFTAELLLPELRIITSDDEKKGEYLIRVLKEAKRINSSFLNQADGLNVTTRLNYPQQWGLGSSSTFIANVAKWAGVDAMELNKYVSEGSGYDIACTLANGPILYQLKNNAPHWTDVNYSPAYSDHLNFLFLGKKQDTSNSIVNFRKNYKFNSKDVTYISGLTHQLLQSWDLKTAISVIHQHETYLSGLLGIETVKSSLFSDFNGSVKSLGAWGGDFAIVASEMSFMDVETYFYKKGFRHILKFKEMALLPDLVSMDVSHFSGSHSGEIGKL